MGLKDPDHFTANTISRALLAGKWPGPGALRIVADPDCNIGPDKRKNYGFGILLHGCLEDGHHGRRST
jgi:hypothetical protein